LEKLINKETERKHTTKNEINKKKKEIFKLKKEIMLLENPRNGIKNFEKVVKNQIKKKSKEFLLAECKKLKVIVNDKDTKSFIVDKITKRKEEIKLNNNFNKCQ
jgi:hypothetical protein